MLMQATQAVIREVAAAHGYKMAPQFITKHNADVIDLVAASARVSYVKTNDPVYDQHLHQLCPEEISNIYKHEEAWGRIAATASNGNSMEDLHLVVEDDVLFNEDCKAAFINLMSIMKAKSTSKTPDWDMVMCGLAHPQQESSTDFKLWSVSSKFPVLPNKEAYFITPEFAKKAHDYMKSNLIRFTTRIFLSWWTRVVDARVFYPSKRSTIDGSKLGIFPSTIHTNNLLMLNFEFMELLRMYQKPAEEIDQKLANELFKRVLHFKSPDAMHIYGAILAKVGRYKDAAEVLEEGCEENIKKQGLLNGTSELLSNALAVHKYMQNDLKEYRKNKSKFESYSI